ncbi:MAG: SRPBCC family protein [Turneriella sp.]
MKIVKRILIGLVVVVAGIFIVAATRPNTYTVERSLKINAAPEKIFPYLISFKKGLEWSAWDKQEEEVKRTFTGPESGMGAIYEFEGKKSGHGKLSYKSIVPNEEVKMDLTFYKPMQGSNDITYSLKKEGDATVMKYHMTGPAPIIARIIWLFADMDKYMGDKFNESMQNLKKIVEEKK